MLPISMTPGAPGNSGIVPLMAMLRHRASSGEAGRAVPARLLHSSRSLADIISCDELERLGSAPGGPEIVHTLTRQAPRPGWRGHNRRIEAPMLAEVGFPPAAAPADPRLRPDADGGGGGGSAGRTRARAPSRQDRALRCDRREGEMTSDGISSRLDGNAAGGLLLEVFAFEATAAQTTCAGCARVSPLGELRLYALAGRDSQPVRSGMARPADTGPIRGPAQAWYRAGWIQSARQGAQQIRSQSDDARMRLGDDRTSRGGSLARR